MTVVSRGSTTATLGTDAGPLVFGSYPTYKVGDTLIVAADVCGDFGSRGNWTADPTGWTKRGECNHGTEHRTGVWTRIATGQAGSGNDAFSLSIANQSNTRGKVGNYWALSPCRYINGSFGTDATNDTTYTLPAVTGTASPTGALFGVISTITGKTVGNTSWTDSTQQVTAGSAASGSLIRTLFGDFAGTDPAAATGSITSAHQPAVVQLLFEEAYPVEPLQFVRQAVGRAASWMRRHDGIFVPERRFWAPNPS